MSKCARCYFKLPAGNKHHSSEALIKQVIRWVDEYEPQPQHWNWYYDDPYVVVMLPDNAMALKMKLSITQ